nr:hypothetical protein [Tanacetum cinerariifolium]
MHGHGHPELAKKLNDKIPKTVDEMFKRVRAFIRGEVATGSAKMVCPSKGDKGYVRPAWSGVPEKAKNRGGPREAQRDMAGGHNTNDYYQLKKQIEEAVTSRKLVHLVKDIRQNNQRNGNQGRNDIKVINMISEEGNRKIPLQEGRFGLMSELTFLTIPQSQLTDEPIILEGFIEGNQVQRILVDDGSSSKIMYEYCFRNRDNNIRSRLRRCKTLMIGFSGETYHPLGLISLRVTMGREGRKRLWCKYLERIQGSWKEVQWHQREEKMSRIREQVILRARSNSGRRPSSGLMLLEKTRSKEDVEEVFTINDERPNQFVTMGATLTKYCKQLLVDVLWENMEVFAWVGLESTAVLQFVMEHQLRMYTHAELVVHKKRPMEPEGRLALKEKRLFSILFLYPYRCPDTGESCSLNSGHTNRLTEYGPSLPGAVIHKNVDYTDLSHTGCFTSNRVGQKRKRRAIPLQWENSIPEHSSSPSHGKTNGPARSRATRVEGVTSSKNLISHMRQIEDSLKFLPLTLFSTKQRQRQYISNEGASIYRLNGQGVHDIFQGSPNRPWNPDEPRINKIVFIGKNLDAKELEKGFKTCIFGLHIFSFTAFMMILAQIELRIERALIHDARNKGVQRNQQAFYYLEKVAYQTNV